MSELIKAVHPRYIAIEASELQADPNQVLKQSQQVMAQEIKKQNVGIVKAIGSKCDPWLNVGDKVSFYRNAATPVLIGGEELLLIHEDHILVSFKMG